MENHDDRGMARAVVSHGAVETRYRRAGHGPPVVFLGFSFDDDSRVPGPLVPLIDCCRVIVPEHSSIVPLESSFGPDSALFTGWLRGFLEGLGIEGARVVAASRLGVALAHFLVTYPGEIDRLLLVDATADVAWGSIIQFVCTGEPSKEPFAAS